MGTIFGMETGMSMPDIFSGFNTTVITVIVVIFMFFFFVALGIWLFHTFRTYNRKIVVFENVSGQGFQPVYKDRARLISIGDGGEEILYLLKKKVYRSAYGRKMGKNTYWFVIGQDGYWYNSVLGDIDAKMGMLDIEPIDRDMRYMHVAVRKNITERYRKIKFMEKYGAVVVSMIVVLFLIGGIWFILDKMAETAGANAGAIKTSKEVMELVKEVMGSLDNVCGGSGIKPA